MVGFTAAQLWAGLFPLSRPRPRGWARRCPPRPGVARAPRRRGPPRESPRRTSSSPRAGRDVTGSAVTTVLPSLAPARRLPRWGVSAADWVLAALVLHLLLPPASAASRSPWFVGLFVAAQSLGLASQLPGGVGRVERDRARRAHPHRARAAGACRASSRTGSSTTSRPSWVAFALLALNEIVARRDRLGRVLRGRARVLRAGGPLARGGGEHHRRRGAPRFGRHPGAAGRLRILRHACPSRSSRCRTSSAAWWGGTALPRARLPRRLGGGSSLTRGSRRRRASLLKGLDWEEARSSPALLPRSSRSGGLLPPRRALDEPFAPWLAAVVVVGRGSIWLGLFAYRTSSTRSDLWFQFASMGTRRASCARRSFVWRSASASLSAACSRRRRSSRSPARGARSRRPRRGRQDSTAHLALAADKAILSGRRLLIPHVRRPGADWVAMGDPVGPAAERPSSLRFREPRTPRRLGLFYQVGPGNLPRFLDLGLAFLRLGEEATCRSPLLAPRRERRPLRRRSTRGARPAPVRGRARASAVAALLPQLRGISDGGCRRKMREKGFSLGIFDERYLREGPVVLVRHDGRARRVRERMGGGAPGGAVGGPHAPRREDAPRSTMDFLFVSLLRWGRRSCRPGMRGRARALQSLTGLVLQRVPGRVLQGRRPSGPCLRRARRRPRPPSARRPWPCRRPSFMEPLASLAAPLISSLCMWALLRGVAGEARVVRTTREARPWFRGSGGLRRGAVEQRLEGREGRAAGVQVAHHPPRFARGPARSCASGNRPPAPRPRRAAGRAAPGIRRPRSAPDLQARSAGSRAAAPAGRPARR